jgi:hypothetical protein
VPSGPTPGAPNQVPAPFYSTGPTAEQDSVTQRSRPEFLPTGFEFGTLLSKIGLVDASKEAEKRSGFSSFVVFPKLEFETAYESNLFRTSSETSDEVFIASPSLSIRSDWGRHALELFGSADIARYVETTSEDYQEFLGRISGRADLYDNLAINALVQYGQRHQQRGDLIDPGDTSSAIVINQGRVRIGAELEFAAVTLLANIESETEDFVSSATIDNEDLDRDEHIVTVRASLEVDSGTSIFVQPKYNLRNFSRNVDSSGFEQDTRGFEVLGGIRWDASGVTFAEFGLGYLWQNFDESTFAIIQGVTASAQVIWNFTDLWTWTLGISREVSETSDQDLSGVLNTSVKSRLDYEFLYNTILSLSLQFNDEDFKSSSRSDGRTRAGFKVRHLFNALTFAELDAKYERVSSNDDTEDFKAATGMIRLGVQY